MAVHMLLHQACSPGRPAVTHISGDTLDIRHATLLRMVECDGYTVAEIKNPWGGGLLHRYVLLSRGETPPATLPEGTILRVPLDNILLFSTVHTELLEQLRCIDAVSGVCDARYMSQPSILDGLSNGTIVDCGSTLNVNLERVVQLSPEAVWVLPFENGGYGKLDKLKLPLVECAEYMETTPLGGAEWMRFYGRLLGCGNLADSLFATVEQRYIALRDTLATIENRPTLLCELKNNSAWYLPAGNSTMGQLYRDAGADYLFASNSGSGALPLAYEAVLHRAVDADIWLIKYGADKDKTYTSLLSEFDGYKYFSAYKNRNIYSCNVSRKRFYEETPFRPDILLRELAAIFHPLLFSDYQLRYYEKMQE